MLKALTSCLATFPKPYPLFKKSTTTILNAIFFKHSPTAATYRSNHQAFFLQTIDPNFGGNAVKKSGKIGLSLLLSGALLTSYCHANESQKPVSSINHEQPVIFSSEKELSWVKQCIKQHPEMTWLADERVHQTEEGTATLQGTYSEQLFGQKYIEFDRTIMTLHCLRLFLEGSDEAYVKLTASQPEKVKLSKESFDLIHLKAKQLLNSNWNGMSQVEMAEAMEAELVLGDIGKSEKARELFSSCSINAPDHDDFYGEAMQFLKKDPSLCPSFAKLSELGQQLLAKEANLAHYGHITHLEGGIEMFKKLKESGLASSDPVALQFSLFMYLCDAAGALGHINNQSSLVYTQPTHQAIQAMIKAVNTLSDPNKNEWDAYNAYLHSRALWLGLDPHEGSERVLARIGAMLRLFTLEEGTTLKKGIQALSSTDRQKVTEQLDVHSQNQIGRTPTYMPAVLVNLANNPELGNTKEERLYQAIALGLPFIARVLERHKELLLKNAMDANIPLNFNKIAKIAKISFTSLSGEFTIDQEGNVDIIAKEPS